MQSDSSSLYARTPSFLLVVDSLYIMLCSLPLDLIAASHTTCCTTSPQQLEQVEFELTKLRRLNLLGTCCKYFSLFWVTFVIGNSYRSSNDDKDQSGLAASGVAPRLYSLGDSIRLAIAWLCYGFETPNLHGLHGRG